MLCPKVARHLTVALLLAAGCDRREEVTTARDPSACTPRDLGAAEDLAPGTSLPTDRMVTVEGMPHQAFFGWTEGERHRAVSKILGTDRRLYVVQQFEGDSPPTTTTMTGLLRRWADLPPRPWEQVKRGIRDRFGWQVPEDAYVILEGVRPRGCD